jgi:hypothetical protein
MGETIEYVSVGEFGRTMRLLEEIRTDIKGDVADLRIVIVNMKDEITGRQDEANGRTTKNEGALLAATAQLASVQATVTHIDTHGCQALGTHKAAVGVLKAAGVVPDRDSWMPTKRQAGVGAAIGGGVIGVIELAKVVVTHFWK